MPSIKDEYEKLQIIGQGSFATIWKVRHRKYGYIRTLKILNTPVQDENDRAYQQFVKECTVLLNIGNGANYNIVHIYQPRLIDNRAVVEMDFIDGETLDQHLRRNKFMPIDEVLRFIGDIGGALAYCHHDIYKYMMNPNEDDLKSDPDDGRRYIIDEATEQRLVRKYAVTHNDLHSNNVMRRENDGSYVLLDFGLAIQNGTAVKSSALRGGALEYMAPEKFDDNNVITTQSDIYSFGILMYEALAGRVPFVLGQGASFSDQTLLYQQHNTGIPPEIEPLRREAFEAANPGQAYKKDYPDWLEAMIKKCLEKNPADRYANAKELMNDFKAMYQPQMAAVAPNVKVVEKIVEKRVEVPVEKTAPEPVKPTYISKPQLPPKAKTSKPSKKQSDPETETKKWIMLSLLGFVLTVWTIIGVGIALFGNNVQEEWTEIAGDTIEYVDLGLPSGTKWKDINETNPNDRFNFYTYDEAVAEFGNQLPTKEQFDELTENCTYVWDESARGCWFYGPNGNSIFLPAAGIRYCYGDDSDVDKVGSNGYYWSSTPDGSEEALYPYFNSGGVYGMGSSRCHGLSVRLVQD